MRILNDKEKFTFPDWPFGFTARCVMNVWTEYKSGKGNRIVYQTEAKGRLNAPKLGIYQTFLWLGEHNGELYKIHMNIAGQLSVSGWGKKTPPITLEEVEKEIKEQIPMIEVYQTKYKEYCEKRGITQ